MFRITFSNTIVKRMKSELKKAYERGDVRAVRRLSVLMMIGERMTLALIVTTWNICEQTVYNWLNTFLSERWDSIEYGKPSGRPARLTKTQKRQLYKWVKAGPEKAGYSTGCWSSVLIQDLIYQKFHVLYNRFYVCELLRNLGFSRQKAQFVSDHLDAEARRRWMKEEWPQILSRAKKLEAPLFFGDEASFALWGSLSYTWAPVGQTPLVKTTGIRKGYKLFGLIEFFSGRLLYQGIEDRFDSDSYQSFLKYLLSQYTGPVILIQDGAKYHTSKSTHEFIEANKKRLIVYQLPSYSPDYNPIEYLWKKVKTKATHNRYFPEFVQLIQSVEKAMSVLASQTDVILQLMGVYTQHLAAPHPV